MNESSETYWAYIAGLLDRHGAFSIWKSTQWNSYQFAISITTKSEKRIKLLQNEIKGKVVKNNYSPKSKLGSIDGFRYIFYVDIIFFDEISSFIYKHSLRKEMLNIFMKMRSLIKSPTNIKLDKGEIEERTKTYQEWLRYRKGTSNV